MAYLRLRQICLVADTLEPLVADLCQVLGLTVCHRDPGVERFGLHNALLRIGNSFIEVVAPLSDSRGDGTAATRHLALGKTMGSKLLGSSWTTPRSSSFFR